ncbi:MAG: hypothetical protein ACTS5G_00080 [Burkholderiales bacterium]
MRQQFLLPCMVVVAAGLLVAPGFGAACTGAAIRESTGERESPAASATPVVPVGGARKSAARQPAGNRAGTSAVRLAAAPGSRDESKVRTDRLLLLLQILRGPK